MCFGLPIHTNSTNKAHDEKSYRSDYPGVIGTIVYNGHVLGPEQLVEGITEADSVHACCHGVGEREYDPYGRTEFGSERSRYQEINSSYESYKSQCRLI